MAEPRNVRAKLIQKSLGSPEAGDLFREVADFLRVIGRENVFSVTYYLGECRGHEFASMTVWYWTDDPTPALVNDQTWQAN